MRSCIALLHGEQAPVGASPPPCEPAAEAAPAPALALCRPQSRRPAVSPEPGHPLSDPSSSPWQHSPFPWAVTELDGPGDTAGTQLMGAWHVASLGKNKSWKCRDPADIREPSLHRTPRRRSRAPPRP